MKREFRSKLPWTDEEKQFLRDNHGKLSLLETSKALNRGKAGVHNMRVFLGLARRHANKFVEAPGIDWDEFDALFPWPSFVPDPEATFCERMAGQRYQDNAKAAARIPKPVRLATLPYMSYSGCAAAMVAE